MNSKKTIVIWSKVLAAALELKPVREQQEIIDRLARVLRRRKKSYLLPKILETAGRQIKQRHRIRLTLAREQPREATDRLAKKITGYFGGQGNVELGIDAGLIGGFVARTENYLIDASIKNFLNQLKNPYG